MACSQAQHRHLGEGSPVPFWITGCPCFQTHASPPEGLAPRTLAPQLLVNPPPPHAALSLVVPAAALSHCPRHTAHATLPTPQCPRHNVSVLWPSQFLPALLGDRVTHTLSTSVIVSLRSHDYTSLEFGT